MATHDTTTPDPAAAPTEPGRVELSVPMQPRWSATVRLLAASVAADLGFSVDEIDDLRLAVSEAMALVLSEGDPDDRLEVSLEGSGDVMSIEIGARSGRQITPPDELATNVLRAVTDHFEIRSGSVRLVSSTLRLGGN